MLPAPLTVPIILFVIGSVLLILCVVRFRSARLRARGRARRVTEYIVLSLGIALAVLMTVGTTWNIVEHDRFVAAHPAPGQIYNVNGYKMHLWCTGSGSPTIIIDAGLGGGSAGWQRVQPQLSKTTRVCSYDRAGEGWSELQPGPRDSDHIVQQMRDLLQAAHIDGPLVLMGHSGAGFFMREYATKYPQDVVGMVMVDVGTPRLQLRGSKELQAVNNFKVPWSKIILLDTVVNMGVLRLAGKCMHVDAKHGWGIGPVQAEMECFPPIPAIVGEFEQVAQDGEETYQTGPYKFPILIFSETWSDPTIQPQFKTPQLNAESIKVWNDLQTELKGLSPDSRQILVANTGHLIMTQRPEVLLKEIPPFIERIRQNGPPTALNGTTITE
jgi:pimeloyl-ACP methyl ester carboxylesterase